MEREVNHTCDVCGAEYTTPLAAAMCAEDDLEQDANTREWFAKYRAQKL